MVRRVRKKAGAILLAASLTIGMCSPSVSAAVKIPKSVQAKTARYIQPEEWNKPELIAYQFNSTDDFAKYELTGGFHLYDKNYKEKDHWIKVKVQDPGIFYVLAISESPDKIVLYDATKKKVIYKNVNEDEHMRIVNAGEEFYLKLPTKIKKTFVTVGVLKGEFSSMSNDKSYYEIGKGTAIGHPFSLSKRSKVSIKISAIGKKIGNISVGLEKDVKGKWDKIGRTTIKSNSDARYLTYGLSSGKYRLVLKNPKNQIMSVEYDRETEKKVAAYKKAKAKKIHDYIENIYTVEEQAPRWYKMSVTSTKKKNFLWFSQDTVEDGFKFSIYKQGKKKEIKTIKLNKEEQMVQLPKEKGTYYIKVSKLTKKTNGEYGISTDW